MSLDVGDRVGDYEIVERLGGGGIGSVFKARHEITGRFEALKVLHPDRESDPEHTERFLREVQLQAALDHPNIAGVRTAFRQGETIVMIQELVDGESLASVQKSGPVARNAAVAYIRQALAALAYAHEHGVVHRDVKPANMIVRPDGRLKVCDFGLAKGRADPALTESGIPIGSPYYMAPEQVRGRSDVDARADIYAIGAVLYELVTGRLPFPGESAVDVMMAHLEEPPRAPIELDPEIPRALNDLTLRALAKQPEQRFRSAAEMLSALEAAESDPSAPLSPAGTSRLRKPLLVAGGLLIACVLGFATWRWAGAGSSPDAAPPVAGGAGSDQALLNGGGTIQESAGEGAAAGEQEPRPAPGAERRSPESKKSSPLSPTPEAVADPVPNRPAAPEELPGPAHATFVLPERITVRLERGFGSDSSEGAALDARIVSPASLEGAVVGGRVLESSSSGKPRGESKVRYAFNVLYHDGEAIPIEARTLAFRNSSGRADADDLGSEIKHRTGVFRKIGSSVRRLFGGGRDASEGHPNTASGRASRIEFAAGSELDLELQNAP